MDFSFLIKFQLGGLTHDHELSWVKDGPQYHISLNEDIECFVDKYLITNQTCFKP
jgi:hypothetical protein